MNFNQSPPQLIPICILHASSVNKKKERDKTTTVVRVCESTYYSTKKLLTVRYYKNISNY